AKRGIHIILVLQNHGQFSARTNPEWASNPYNRANGGPLARPADFFTDPRARALTKQRYRYIVARWGYRTNLLAWELFNEVDLTDDYDSPAVAAWHAEMASYIKSIDPFDHPVTTSFSNPARDPRVWRLPEIDFTNTHFYGVPDIAALVVKHDGEKSDRYGKATFSAEFGPDWRGPSQADTAGVNLHNALWVSPFSGATATAMTWWWDNYIHPRDLYSHFRSLAAFLGDSSWLRPDRQPFVPQVRAATRGDLLIEANAGWAEKPADVRFVIDSGEVRRPEAVAQFLYGARYNTQYRTDPVRFEVVAEAPTALGVHVLVAARSGARLEAAIDGKAALREDFAPTDQDRSVDEVYWVSIPPGRHTVTFENTGTDWIQIGGYVLRGAVPRPRAFGLRSGEQILVWVQDRAHIWSRVVAGYEPVLIEGAEVIVPDVPPGGYAVEIWDSWAGRPLETRTLRATAEGLVVPLPPFRRDLALKIAPAASR
ncbi:MAG TPA: hypothetical protein VF234_07970, partial [Limnochordia bacterium]